MSSLTALQEHELKTALANDGLSDNIIKALSNIKAAFNGDIVLEISPLTTTRYQINTGFTRYVTLRLKNAAGQVQTWVNQTFVGALSVGDTSTAGTASLPNGNDLTFVNGEAVIPVEADATDWLDSETNTLTVSDLDLIGYTIVGGTSVESILFAPISAVPDEALTEANLDGRTLELTLAGDEFLDDILNAGNITLNNAPTGLTVDSIVWVDATHAILTLAYDGTDFDADITDFSITIAGAEMLSAEDNKSSDLTISAIVESAAATPASAMVETNLNNMDITIVLTNETYFDATPDIAKYTLNNAPAGVTVASAIWNSATSVTLTLAYDGTDFDADISNFNISIDGTELTSGKPLTTNNMSITSNAETASATPTSLMVEELLDGGTIEVDLTNDTFLNANPTPGNFTLNNAPTGLTVASVVRNTTTKVTLTLDFDGTDFDVDASGVSITIAAAELESNHALTTSNSWTISANIYDYPGNTTSLAFGGTDEVLTFAHSNNFNLGSGSMSWFFRFKTAARHQNTIWAHVDGVTGVGWAIGGDISAPGTTPFRITVSIADAAANAVGVRTATNINSLVNTWVTIGIVYNVAADTCKIYLNGVDDTEVLAGTVSPSGLGSSDATIVMDLGASTEYADFATTQMDECVIYKGVALSAADMLALHNSGSSLVNYRSQYTYNSDGLNKSTPVASAGYLAFWCQMGDGASFPNFPDLSGNSYADGVAANMESGDIVTDVD